MTAALKGAEIVAGNKVYKCEDPDGFAFGIISSSMFITWQKAVGGRIKNDPAFSNTLTWNSFPLPEVSDAERQSIIEAGARVLEARAKHPERTLAQHYAEGFMDTDLLKAHAALDRVVDRQFSQRKCETNERRAQLLFERYAQLTTSKKY